MRKWNKRHRCPVLPLILLLVLMLSGCGMEVQENFPEKTHGKAPAYNKDLITIGLIQTGKESDWRDANTRDYMETFTEENGYNLIYIDGNSDPERQIKAMQDLIVQKVDYIVLQPIIETGWDKTMEMAEEAGIPVIVADRQVSLHTASYLTWVGSNFYAEGQKAVEWLDSYLQKKERVEEDINIVLIEGTKGASAAIGRTKGILEGIEAHENWHLIAREDADFSQGKGQTVMSGLLKSLNGKKIDVLICENDNMMFGAMDAMDKWGLTYGKRGDIITISFDALGEAFEMMISGKLMASVECNPLLAEDVEFVIEMSELGMDIAEKYYTKESIFDYKNAYLNVGDREY